MAWKSILYQDAKPQMKAGDVIAFSGLDMANMKGNFSLNHIGWNE